MQDDVKQWFSTFAATHTTYVLEAFMKRAKAR